MRLRDAINILSPLQVFPEHLVRVSWSATDSEAMRKVLEAARKSMAPRKGKARK
jgi:hypothetical protein